MVNLLLGWSYGWLPFWVFDQKQDTRHLAKLGQGIFALRLDTDLRFNPFEPYAGVNRDRWRQVVIDLLCQGTDLLLGSKTYALDALHCLATRMHPLAPTVREFAEFIQEDMKHMRPYSPSRQYAERVLGRLGALLVCLGRTFDCRRGFPIEHLVRMNLVFEMDGIESMSAQFLLRALLFAVYHWWMDHRPRTGAVEHIIVIDEAQNVVSPLEEAKHESGIPFIDLMVQRAGEFGMRFVLCSQSSRLAYAIKENSRTTVAFNLPEGSELDQIGRRMCLTRAQVEAIAHMGVGTAVVHIAPLLQRLESTVLRAAPVPQPAHDEGPKHDPLTLEMQDLLRHVLQFPGMDWRQRTDALRQRHNMSDAAARAATDWCENLGVLETVRVTKGRKRGGSFVGVVLTQKGRDLLSERGAKVGKAGRRDARHRFWVAVVEQHLGALGHGSEIEADMRGGVFVDVLVRKPGGERLAMEIETSTDTCARNVRKTRPLGLDMVVLACDGDAIVQSVRRKLEAGVGGGGLTGVEVVAVQQYLPEE